MRFLRETKGWIVAENWKNVIFGDETHIVILYWQKQEYFGLEEGRGKIRTLLCGPVWQF